MEKLGQTMRKFHDVTENFVQQENDSWMLSYPGMRDKEVICHNDIAPYNTVFENGIPTAFIDFDTCCPAPRIWDIVYAMYRFVPFVQKYHTENHAHKRDCIEAFFKGYNIPCPEDLFVVMIERLQTLADFILQEANDGNKAFVKMLADGHRDLYLSEIKYIEMYQNYWI